MNWLHFIGGFYTPRKFIAEAKEVGANRKVAPNLAKSFSFGDVVICLYYLRGMVKAFAEFRVDRITFDGADGIGQELERQGKAVRTGDGDMVVRACGSYCIAGTWTVTATLAEIVELAREIDPECSCFIGGPLTKVYKPVWLEPPPKHFRGFKRTDEAFDGQDLGVMPTPEVVLVEDYKKRKKKHREDVQYLLPGLT